jgi:lysophospholipase L1-like esterase
VAVALLVMLGVLATSSPAWAGQSGGGGHRHSPSYLALGDSVPFGYRASVSGQDYRDATSFVGYPEKIAADRHLRLLNASCPGETTDSFQNTSAPSNGCENSPAVVHYRGTFPLHVDYGTQSQLDYARQVLSSDRSVRLVTLQLGANDAFLCQETTPDHCAAADEAVGVGQHVADNLTTILSALRATGYRGQIVVVTYYSLTYADARAAAGTQGLATVITIAARDQGARVADGFEAFRKPAATAGGDSRAAGLVLPGDVHPTDRGQRLLADAVEAVLGK